MTTPTSIARQDGVTAMWYGGRVISAWYDATGDSANLWLGYALTVSPQDNRPAFGTKWSEEAADLANLANCDHGLPRHVCMICARPDGGLIGG